MFEKEAEEKCKKYKLVEIETYKVEDYIEGAEPREKRIEELEKEITHLKELLLELYDCIPSSMADSCRETLQKVALVFKED